MTRIASESSGTFASGTVVRTDPAAGTSVASGSTVAVFVSSGRAPVVVPDVRGRTAAEARAVLVAAGLGYTEGLGAPSEASAVGRVVAQSPPARFRVEPGTEVVVQLGRGPVGSTVATTTTAVTLFP